MECEETARYPSREALGGGSGQEIDPSNCPPAHSALLPDTCIDLTGRYGHRFAALLSTPALFTSLCLQTKAVQHRLHLMGALLFLPCYHPPSPPVPQPLLWVSSRYEPSGGAGGLISGSIRRPSPNLLAHFSHVWRRWGSQKFTAATDQHTLTKGT